jgi:hypothetical protein
MVACALLAWKAYSAGVAPAFVGIACPFGTEISGWTTRVVVADDILSTGKTQAAENENKASQGHEILWLQPQQPEL